MFSQVDDDDKDLLFYTKGTRKRENLVRDFVVVCNPIIYLPESRNLGGWGFSPKNNQCKVTRIFARWIKNRSFRMVEIHTLRTDSWRSVVISEFKVNNLCSQTHTHTHIAIHWLLYEEDEKDSNCIVSFDLDEKQLHFYSIPSPCQKRNYLNMGVPGGCLYVCDSYN
ncbi:hypothetical protein TIFTF001_001703 [Ficus carica]|uniref:F-box associated domain-containing protein n=1 Tax=Ficus carica TaxID=3494 RepID=A0AA87ZA50_FICCA|nr:hypothetical protein TIFTF001_001703 [Ficus carica]